MLSSEMSEINMAREENLTPFPTFPSNLLSVPYSPQKALLGSGVTQKSDINQEAGFAVAPPG